MAHCLPLSDGNTTILSIVHCFSKCVHSVCFSKLPSASQIADLVVYHVLYPWVLDWGPLFISSFCGPLEVSVSLSLGYHPQSNDETKRASQTLEIIVDMSLLVTLPPAYNSFFASTKVSIYGLPGIVVPLVQLLG